MVLAPASFAAFVCRDGGGGGGPFRAGKAGGNDKEVEDELADDSSAPISEAVCWYCKLTCELAADRMPPSTPEIGDGDVGVMALGGSGGGSVGETERDEPGRSELSLGLGGRWGFELDRTEGAAELAEIALKLLEAEASRAC